MVEPKSPTRIYQYSSPLSRLAFPTLAPRRVYKAWEKIQTRPSEAMNELPRESLGRGADGEFNLGEDVATLTAIMRSRSEIPS